MQERFGLDKHAYERSSTLFRFPSVFILIFSVIFLDIRLFACLHTIMSEECFRFVHTRFVLLLLFPFEDRELYRYFEQYNSWITVHVQCNDFR